MDFETRKKSPVQSIRQYADSLVERWTEAEEITLRPSEKKRLKVLIAKSVPDFLSINGSEAFDHYVEKTKSSRSKACVAAVNDLPEPFSGLVSKQRAINACAHATESTTNSIEVVSAEDDGYGFSMR